MEKERLQAAPHVHTKRSRDMDGRDKLAHSHVLVHIASHQDQCHLFDLKLTVL